MLLWFNSQNLDNSDYCYNMTASAGILLSAWKAGCSTYRCFLSQDTCRSMDLQVSYFCNLLLSPPFSKNKMKVVNMKLFNTKF